MATSWQADSGDTDAILRAVRRVARALALASRDLARQHGLTAPQLMCLRLLNEQGALSAGALAGALSLSPQTVTGLIDRLHARELVTRVRSETDRRQVRIGLTDQGRGLIRAAAPGLQDRFVARLDTLETARRAGLREALDTVVTLLEAEALDAAPLLAPGDSLACVHEAGTRGAPPRPDEGDGSAAPTHAGDGPGA